MGLAMRLADFIQQNAREILEDAVAFAETQAPDTVESSAQSNFGIISPDSSGGHRRSQIRRQTPSSSQSPTGLHR